MNRDRYDPILKECKDCGCLIPDRTEDIHEHVCSPYAIEAKLKKLFGQREPKEEQKFKIGDEVEANLMGTIDSILVTREGNIVYRIVNDSKNLHGYFTQSQVTELPQEEDFDDFGVGDLEYERQKEEGTTKEGEHV